MGIKTVKKYKVQLFEKHLLPPHQRVHALLAEVLTKAGERRGEKDRISSSELHQASTLWPIQTAHERIPKHNYDYSAWQSLAIGLSTYSKRETALLLCSLSCALELRFPLHPKELFMLIRRLTGKISSAIGALQKGNHSAVLTTSTPTISLSPLSSVQKSNKKQFR